MQLKGKKVVLTGAQGGIGRCLSALLKNADADVIAIGRQAEIDVVQVDLADNQCVETLCTDLANQDVDILINLAGLMHFGDVTELSGKALDNMMSVNLTTPIKLTQAVIPRMLVHQRGQIVNVGSIFGSLPFPYFSAYSSSKAGLKGFSDALRREYYSRGIKVTHISPRGVDTPFNTPAIDLFNKQARSNIDSSEKVAEIIMNAIVNEKKTVNIGFSENMFVHINSLLPSFIDKALVSKQTIASQILAGDPL